MRWPVFGVLAALAGCGARTGLPVDGDGGETGGSGGSGGSGGQGGEGGSGGQGVGGVEQIALGASHTCLRTRTGDVYCWGRNGDGQLGIGAGVDQVELPERVPLAQKATYLAAGTYHTCAVLEDGRTSCWGKNVSGQVGNGAKGDDVFDPTPIATDAVAVALALGEAHSCGVFGTDRALLCWGSGSDGQTGVAGGALVPTKVTDGVLGVAAGAFHTCFLANPGVVQCMGANADGQLGVPVVTGAQFQTPVDLPASGVTAIASGRGFHSCAISAGGLQCWGDNDEAQLGAGFVSSNELATAPLGLPDDAAVTAVAPGFAHTAALVGGDVYTWGDNYSGQLGFVGGDAPTATRVTALSNVVAIGTGTVHSCAYVSPTEIYCWGSNDFGQLGDGTTQSSSVPVAVVLPP